MVASGPGAENSELLDKPVGQSDSQRHALQVTPPKVLCLRTPGAKLGIPPPRCWIPGIPWFSAYGD